MATDFFALCDTFRLERDDGKRTTNVEPSRPLSDKVDKVMDGGDDDDDHEVPCSSERAREVDENVFDEAWERLRDWRDGKDGEASVDEFHSLVVSLAARPQARFQCLVAALMSVQCLDRVALRAFQRLRDDHMSGDVTIERVRKMDRATLESALKTLNLWRAKAKYIKECSEAIHFKFRDTVPRTVGALKTLPGVGDKLAHLVASVSYDENSAQYAGVVVDTHVQRVSRRLGWVGKCDDPERVRMKLQAKVHRDDWEELTLGLIALGQNVCHSRNPACDRCPLQTHCPAAPRAVEIDIE
ncbi:endonuclease III [Ostreococcus tauri]|jgi:endonuclease III|uniref:Endonuclease III n=1 Tax=Ostreococcus tauri TaxID=70448 RepID=A0A1Y5IA72_OSTTA|nr:endonuclease III [Ostreococcus tauri]